MDDSEKTKYTHATDEHNPDVMSGAMMIGSNAIVNANSNSIKVSGSTNNDTGASREEAIRLWQEVTGGEADEASFFLRCAGGDVARAINRYFENPDRFTRIPASSDSQTEQQQTASTSASDGTSNDTITTPATTGGHDGAERALRRQLRLTSSVPTRPPPLHPPALRRDASTTSISTTYTSSTTSTASSADSYMQLDANTNASRGLADEHLLELSKGFFRIKQVVRMCCFLKQKTLRLRDVRGLRDHLHSTTGVSVSSRRLVKLITDNRQDVVVGSLNDTAYRSTSSSGGGGMGAPSARDGEEQEVPLGAILRKYSDDTPTTPTKSSTTTGAVASTSTPAAGVGVKTEGISLPSKRRSTSMASIRRPSISRTSSVFPEFVPSREASLTVEASAESKVVGAKVRPAAYWERLPAVLLQPDRQSIAQLSEEDIRIVVIFLQIGNLTTERGCVQLMFKDS